MSAAVLIPEIHVPGRDIYVPADVMEWVSRAKKPWRVLKKTIIREAELSLAISVGTIGALKETATGNIASVGLPASPVAGDLMVCPIVGSDNVVSTQASWTLKFGANASTKLRMELWYRRWLSGDTAPTFTRTSGLAAIARIFIVKGVIASGDPFDGTPTSSPGTTATITAPTITPGAGNTADGLFLFGGEERTADTSGAPVVGNFSGTTPTPTQIFTSQATGLGGDMVSMGISWGLKTDAAATGARTATVTGEVPTNVLGISSLLLPDTTPGGFVRITAKILRQAVMRGAMR